MAVVGSMGAPRPAHLGGTALASYSEVPNKDIYTIAGNGTAGFLNTDALASEFNLPTGLALDQWDDLLVAEYSNNVIRIVAANSGNHYGISMAADHVYTLVGTGEGLDAPTGVSVDSGGNIYIADYLNGRIVMLAEQRSTLFGATRTPGSFYTLATGLSKPTDVQVDHNGNLVIAEYQGGDYVDVIAATTNTFYQQSMTAGSRYRIGGNGQAMYGGDGTPATSASFDNPHNVAIDPGGNVLVSDTDSDRLRVIAESATQPQYYSLAGCSGGCSGWTVGDVYTIAGTGADGTSGDGGSPTSATLSWPANITLDQAANIIVSSSGDTDNSVDVRILAQSTGTYYGIPMIAGNIYTVMGRGVEGYSGDERPADLAEIDGPLGLAVDPAGTLIESDGFSNHLRSVAGGPVGAIGVTPAGGNPGQDIWGGCGCSVAEPVNVATGDFYDTTTDLTVPSTPNGVPLAFSRTYDAQEAQAQEPSGTPGRLGYGWTDNLAMTLSSSSGTATVTEPNGALHGFTYFGQGTTESAWCPSDQSAAVWCANAPRYPEALSTNGTTWTLVNSGGKVPVSYTFNSSGTLTAIAENGDTVSSGSYSPSGSEPACGSANTCTKWTSSTSGRSLVTRVTTSTPHELVAVFDPDASGETATFSYSGTGCTWTATPAALCSVTAPVGTTAYTYDTGNSTPSLSYDLFTETPPATGKVTNTYTTSGQVQEQTIATSQSCPERFDFSYATTSVVPGGTTTTVTTYPQGQSGSCTGGTSDTTMYTFSNNVLVEQSSSGSLPTYYERDPASLKPFATIDGDGNVSGQSLQTYNSPGGTSTSSGDATLSIDGAQHTTQSAYTPDNLVWCRVDAADYLNATRCPSTQPTSPPAPGVTDPDLGATISFYDSSDRLTATTDALGRTATQRYTASGNDGSGSVPDGLTYCTVDPVEYQASVTCPSYGAAHVPGTLTKTFDASGDVLSSIDALGHTTTTNYGARNGCGVSSGMPWGSPAYPWLPATVTDPDGTMTCSAYDASGRLTKTTASFSSYSATTQYAYDTSGRRFCEIDPYEYSKGATCPASAPTSPPPGSGTGSDPWPGATVTIYDGDGRVIDTVNPLGGVAQSAYDPAGEVYCSVAPTAYAKGTTCQPLPITTPTQSSDLYLGATINTYDTAGHLVQVTNPLGGITLNTYDGAGNVTQTQVESATSTQSADPTVTTTTTYDGANHPVTTTVNPNGTPATSERFYDPNGNVYCSVSANAYAQGSSAWSCPAWAAGWVTAPPNPVGSEASNVTTSFSDADGEVVQRSTPDTTTVSSTTVPDTTLTLYDQDGRIYCSLDPDNLASKLTGSSTFPYGTSCPSTPPTSTPALGTNPWPGATVSVYDVDGHTLSSTSGVGLTTLTTYDPSGQPATVTVGTSSHKTTDCYYWQNGTGKCAHGAPATGGSASMPYSTTSPPTQQKPGGAVTTDTFLPGGWASTTTTGAVTTTDGYDAMGDVTQKSYSGVASGYDTPATVTLTYNPDGSRATMADGTGTTTYGYDAMGDRTSAALVAKPGTGLSNETVGYSYYDTGQLATLVYPSYGTTMNPTATYSYDAYANMAQVTDWLGKTTSFASDLDNNPATTTFPNSTASTIARTSADAVSSVTLATTGGSPTTLAQLSYTRDANSQVSGETDTVGITGSATYGYDASERLGNVNGTTQTYDAASNLQTLPPDPGGATGTYDTAGELTSDNSGRAYTLDTIGDRTKSVPTSGTTLNDHYSALGQLDQFGTTTGSTYTQVAGYLDNGDGLRIGKTITSTSTTTTFAWDTTAPVPRILSDGTSDFLYGPAGVVEQVAQSTNTPTYLTEDQLGSTRLLTNATGSVVGTYTYDAYGNPTHTGTATTPIGYAGGYADAESGLLYLVNRYYDPATGQFISVDPALAQTNQPYGYAGDDPVNGSDPSGDLTVGVCAGDALKLGLGSVFHGVQNEGLICLVRTVFEPNGHDDIGLTETLSNVDGTTLGGSVSGGIFYTVSNANDLQQLGGVFTDAEADVGALSIPVGGSASLFWGGKGIIGVQGGVGVGEGEAVSQFTTTTWVQQARQWWIADPLRVIWNSFVPPQLQDENYVAALEISAIEGVNVLDRLGTTASTSRTRPSRACT
ncbi:MAG TPA: RHS repeat-associated core domain-containing protein [Acidimicrobiales bacterium]|nr:RHS repeat-associated core domain-containing protein [Acidimicrobiales bacterium]